MSVLLWIISGVACSASYLFVLKTKGILTVGDVVMAILLLIGGYWSAAMLLSLFMSYTILKDMRWILWSKDPVRLSGMKPVLDIDYTANASYTWNSHCVNSKGKIKVAVLLDAPNEISEYVCDITNYGDSVHHQEAEDMLNKLIRSYDDDEDTLLVSTHNVTLISNDIMRPDCYFVYKDGKALPFNKMTNKELRVAHNLGKMYVAGEFNY